jgi:hypothetical protein
MLDSPVIAGWRSSMLRVSQWTGLDDAPLACRRDPRAPHAVGEPR